MAPLASSSAWPTNRSTSDKRPTASLQGAASRCFWEAWRPWSEGRGGTRREGVHEKKVFFVEFSTSVVEQLIKWNRMRRPVSTSAPRKG